MNEVEKLRLWVLNDEYLVSVYEQVADDETITGSDDISEPIWDAIEELLYTPETTPFQQEFFPTLKFDFRDMFV